MSDSSQHADGRKLLLALKAVLNLIDKGALIRNTDEDRKPDWSFRMMNMVMTLKEAQTVADEHDYLLGPRRPLTPEGPCRSGESK